MRAPPIISILLASLCLSGAAACGSDQDQVKDAVQSFYQAAADGDGETACDLLTPAARAGAGMRQCVSAIDQFGRLGGAEARRRISNISVRGTRVKGDRAVTQIQVPGQSPAVISLRKVDGDWKLESLGGSVGA